MKFSEIFDLIGNWHGKKTLWIHPSDFPRTSTCSARISPIIKNKFLKINYNWFFEEEQQEGKLILGNITSRSIIKAIWFDSWHNNENFMELKGLITKNNVIRLKGSYEVKSGPDWDWLIVIEKGMNDTFRLEMFNISPEGEENLAVKINFKKKLKT